MFLPKNFSNMPIFSYNVFPVESLWVEHGADEGDADNEDGVEVASPIGIIRLSIDKMKFYPFVKKVWISLELKMFQIYLSWNIFCFKFLEMSQ